jgi:hypothetical protein
MLNGKNGPKVEKPLPAAASGDSYTLQIEVAPDRIVVRDAHGVELDRYNRPDRAQPLGRFGFKGEAPLVVQRLEGR